MESERIWLCSHQKTYANKYEHTTQRAAFWSACLEQTLMYDPRTEMSLALTAVLPNDKYFAMPFIVSRRAQN